MCSRRGYAGPFQSPRGVQVVQHSSLPGEIDLPVGPRSTAQILAAAGIGPNPGLRFWPDYALPEQASRTSQTVPRPYHGRFITDVSKPRTGTRESDLLSPDNVTPRGGA